MQAHNQIRRQERGAANMKMMVCSHQTICSPHFLSMKPSQRYCKDVNTFSLTLFYEKIKWTGSRYFHVVVGMFEVEMCFVQCPVEVQCSLSVILLRCVNLMSFNSLEYGVLTPRTPPLLYIFHPFLHLLIWCKIISSFD